MDEEGNVNDHPELIFTRKWTEAVNKQQYEAALSILDEAILFAQQGNDFQQAEYFQKIKEITQGWLIRSHSDQAISGSGTYAGIQPELSYLLECCKAIAEQKYEEAISLFSKGLRENERQAEQIKSPDLIPLLRVLFTEIELSLGANFATGWRKMAQPYVKEASEVACSFCAKKEAEVFKIIAGHGGNICDECVRTCLEVLIGVIAEEANKKNTNTGSDKGA